MYMILKLTQDENSVSNLDEHIEESLKINKYRDLLHKTMNLYKGNDKIIEFEVE